jgi:FG-GAP-like repeat
VYAGTPCGGVSILGVADFNNDSAPDLLIQDTTFSKPYQYWRYVVTSAGGQDLQLKGGSWIGFSGFVYSKGIMDLDGDHNLDVLTLGDVSGIGHTTTAIPYVLVSWGLGNGLFTDVGLNAANSYPDEDSNVSAADVNSDGKMDLIVTHQSGTTTTSYGDGARNFSTTPP